MNEQTQASQTDETEGTEGTEVEKTRIRPDLSRYVRDKSGNGKRTHRTDDFVARTLAGKSVEAIKQGAALLGIDVAKWEHLNPGQQRMLIGNALRNRLADKKAPIEEESITSVYGEPCAPYDAEAAAAAEAATITPAAEEEALPEAATDEAQADTLPSGRPRRAARAK